MSKVKIHYRVDYGIVSNAKASHSASYNVTSHCPSIIYKLDSIESTLQKLFGAAVEEYNSKQTRSDRMKKTSEMISADNRSRAFREVSIWLFPTDDTSEYNFDRAKTILEQYYYGFEERNPNLKVFAAEMRLSDIPRLYIAFIPICHKKLRGVATRISFKGALMEQGYRSHTRRYTEQIAWVKDEKQHLNNLLQNVQ